MAFDALTILRGKNNATPPVLVNCEPSDTQATTVTPNVKGNAIVDLKKTAKKGLAAVMVLPTQPTTYQNTLTVLLEESDELDRNWETLLDFPLIYAYLREMGVAASAAFDKDDIGRVLTSDELMPSVGVIVSIDQALFTIGGVGKIVIEMQTATDVYNLPNDTVITVVATGGAGQGTLVGVAIPKPTAGTYIRRFATSKRYICGKQTVTAGGNFGKVQLLIGSEQHDTL